MALKSHYSSCSGTVFQGLCWLLPLSEQTGSGWERGAKLFQSKNPIPHVGWLSQEKSWGKVTFQPSAAHTAQ